MSRKLLFGIGVVVIGVAVALGRRWLRQLVDRQGGTPMTLGAAVWTGAVAGAFGGLVEAGVLAARHLLFGHPARRFAWDLVWMAPLAAGLTLGAIAFAIALWAIAIGPRRALLRPRSRLVVLPVVALAAWPALAVPWLGLHPAAIALIALGLGTGAARMTDRPAGFGRGLRLASWLLVGGLAGSTALGVWYLPRVREWRALQGLPNAPASAPNVLLLVLDTVRAASLSLYGHLAPTTPNLERWFDGGTVFDWAFAPAPWSLPTHAALFTGRHPAELFTEYHRPLDATHTTVAEIFAKAGYRTGGFTANRTYTSRASGLARGFARYEDYPITIGRFVASSGLAETLLRPWLPRTPAWRNARKRSEASTDEVLRWVDQSPERPFFAFVNYFDAHDTYLSPLATRRRFDPQGPLIIEKREGITEADLAPTRAAYEAAIAHVDEHVGRLLDQLEQRGILDRTVVILTSDHGEHFGEHGLQNHSVSLYRPLLHVPLAIRTPAGKAGPGRRVGAAVSLVDVAATMVELGLGQAESRLGGRSLARFLGPQPIHEAGPVFAEGTRGETALPHEPWFRGRMRSVVALPFHWIALGDGSEELYDLSIDPAETTNLAEKTSYQGTLGRLRLLRDSLDGVVGPNRAP